MDGASLPLVRRSSSEGVDYASAYAFDYRVYDSGNVHANEEPQYFGQSEHRADDRIRGQVRVRCPLTILRVSPIKPDK